MGSDNKGEQLSKASLPLQVCMSVRASGMPFAQDSARGRVEQAHLPPCAVQMPLPLSILIGTAPCSATPSSHPLSHDLAASLPLARSFPHSLSALARFPCRGACPHSRAAISHPACMLASPSSFSTNLRPCALLRRSSSFSMACGLSCFGRLCLGFSFGRASCCRTPLGIGWREKSYFYLRTELLSSVACY